MDFPHKGISYREVLPCHDFSWNISFNRSQYLPCCPLTDRQFLHTVHHQCECLLLRLCFHKVSLSMFTEKGAFSWWQLYRHWSVTTTTGADKVGIMTTLGFHYLTPNFVKRGEFEWCQHWNEKVVRVTALIFTGDVEDKLQRIQWIPRMSPWRPFRFCEIL